MILLQVSGSSPYSRFEEEDPDPYDRKQDPKSSKTYGATAGVHETSFNGNAAIEVFF
jgi:hypothetical protein